MPKVTPRFNVDLATKYGARIELCDDASEAFAKAEDYQRRRDLFLPYLEQAGFEFTAPEGAYYVMTDVGGCGFDDDVAFTKNDVKALKQTAQLVSLGILEPDPETALEFSVTEPRFEFVHGQVFHGADLTTNTRRQKQGPRPPISSLR